MIHVEKMAGRESVPLFAWVNYEAWSALFPFFLDEPPPGADLVDYAPRLKTPTLKVNGRFDFTFPLEESQLPLYRMLGAPAADKNHILMETPHDVLAKRPKLVHDVLEWYDRYLGHLQ